MGVGLKRVSCALMSKTSVDTTLIPGDSAEQREAEGALIRALSKQLGSHLVKHRIQVTQEAFIELDGYCKNPLTFCEAWAHIGAPLSAQKHKVMSDALKLLFASGLCSGGALLILLFADQEAAKQFQNNSWMGQCLRHYKIEVIVIELPSSARDRVLRAQKRQRR